MEKSAHFSRCLNFRYSLSRVWDSSLPRIAILGLNPSTANEKYDDPTVRRCIGFAQSWGYGSIVLVNLFGLRSTSPLRLKIVDDPIGPQNDYWIQRECKDSDLVVVAWGNHGRLLNRDDEVLKRLANPYCLGTTKVGCPRHPLYLASNTRLREFTANRSDHHAV
ncbi:DUF1643 domain-containing protein [bacterium]|nr:DUF1643 domain-containing protein [bacterium]